MPQLHVTHLALVLDLATADLHPLARPGRLAGALGFLGGNIVKRCRDQLGHAAGEE